MTALMYATQRGDEDIVNFLKEKGIKKEEIEFWLAYYEIDEHQKSIEDYTKAIELNPQYAAACNNRGVAHDELGKYQEAVDDYYQTGILYLKKIIKPGLWNVLAR